MNTRRLWLSLTILLAALAGSTSAQNGLQRERRVADNNNHTVPAPTPYYPPAPAPTPYYEPPVQDSYPATTSRTLQPVRVSYGTVKARLNEVSRFFKSRTLPTSSRTGGFYFVTVGAFDPATNRLHYVTLPKQAFLTIGVPMVTTTSLNKQVNVRTVRANGVNTAVVIYDEAGRQMVPLMVEYPIERDGRYAETAYYTSAHPALLSSELTRAGQIYVRNIIEGAARDLQRKGLYISPKIMDVAERLSIVEHADHTRFRNENKTALFYEIYSLFALNEGDTYRYSVSSAGAGGMVQMIPATYAMVRRLYPNAGLQPDFVTGMRNHPNAGQAMLLYMQRTWNDLSASATINNAVANGVATIPELLSAGYNSNPANLPKYVSRGGNNWRSLIPAETKIYLQIYSALEVSARQTPRIDDGAQPVTTPAPAAGPGLPALPSMPGGTRPRVTGNDNP